MDKALLPTNDYVFKRIFGHKGNEYITKGLIETILNREIDEISLDESPILEKDLRDDKVGILDIKARLGNKDIVNIEMQVVKYKNIEKRIMYYWSKLYSGEIHEGDDYSKLHKTIVILIADFELDVTKDISKILTKWEIREEEYCKKVLTDVLEINIIELPKLINALENNKVDNNDKLTLWAKFILSPESIGDEIMSKNEDIKEAKEEFDKIEQDAREKELARLRMKHIMDTKAIRDYGYDEGFEEGKEKGWQAGIEEGIKDTVNNVAKKMLESDIPIEKIIAITGLSKEEIEKLN